MADKKIPEDLARYIGGKNEGKTPDEILAGFSIDFSGVAPKTGRSVDFSSAADALVDPMQTKLEHLLMRLNNERAGLAEQKSSVDLLRELNALFLELKQSGDWEKLPEELKRQVTSAALGR